MAKNANVAEDENVVKSNDNNQKKVDSQKKVDKQKKDKPKKDKKPGLFRRLKDAWGELKKVTWPSFSIVVKKTGVVLLVVILFTIVLFGIDFGLGKLFSLFIG